MLGNPWLFREVRCALAGEPIPPRPMPRQVVDQAMAHLRRHIQRSVYWLQQREGESEATRRLGEDLAVRAMRGHLGWYTRGLRNSAQLRARINQLTTADDIQDLFTAYVKQLDNASSDEAGEPALS